MHFLRASRLESSRTRPPRALREACGLACIAFACLLFPAASALPGRADAASPQAPPAAPAASESSSVVSVIPNGPVYRPAVRDSVMIEMSRLRKERQAAADSLWMDADRRERERGQTREGRLQLRMDWTGIERPAGPEAFSPAFHFPPQAQYMTGTCWSFCATSYFESEVARRTGRKIKLSEMWAVYWEYVEKVRRFVREYGHSYVSSGSEDQGVRNVYRLYGAVPAEAYSGVPFPDGRHDHTRLAEELDAYLAWVNEHHYWDEEAIIAHVRGLLDRELGPPPETFRFEGRTYDPRQFLKSVLRLEMDDYISVVSTLKQPFHEWVLFDVPDNWRREEDYLNLPLDEFYAVLVQALKSGYTVSIGGDTSEPGMDGGEGAAVIPEWDIPAEFINQASREMRIDNGTTTDDHGVHLVGYVRHGGRDWFLAKDSNRSSRLGRFKGYDFYSGDYVRLKSLSYMVPRELLQGRLPEAAARSEQPRDDARQPSGK